MTSEKPAHERMMLGTIIRIGHPANNVAWLKVAYGRWMTNDGAYISPEDVYDTIERGAYELLVGGFKE